MKTVTGRRGFMAAVLGTAASFAAAEAIPTGLPKDVKKVVVEGIPGRRLFHIRAGSDNWQPSPEELEKLIGLFQEALLDPKGAVIATRHDIHLEVFTLIGQL
jgi:hypothetical protein